MSLLENINWKGRLAIGVLVAAVVFGAFFAYNSLTTPSKPGEPSVLSRAVDVVTPDPEPIKVCVNIWGGFAGGQYYNGDFAASKDSRFWKEQGVLVEFVSADNFLQSRATWKSDGCDLLWATVDAFASEADGLADQKPRIQWQVDWSRGGDVAMAIEEVRSVNDMKGKTIAVAYNTPSHSLALWLLNNSGLKPGDVKIHQTDDEKASVAAFKGGNVEISVMWSPDDEASMRDVPRSHVLASTREVTDLIADVFVVKSDTADERLADLKRVYRGWMIGNAELNNDSTAREKAAQIVAQGYGLPAEDARGMISNVRFTTHGDNMNFFGLNPGYTGMTAERLYMKTGDLYKEFFKTYPSDAMGVVRVPDWRTIVDARVVASETSLQGALHVAEGMKPFSRPSPEVAQAPAISSKKITVNFALNSDVLDNANKTLVDREIVDVVRQFRQSYIRIEGNTDSTGDAAYNRKLGSRRIASVVNYLVEQYGFDPNRFVTKSNGPDNPVCNESSPAPLTLDQCRAQNRRTEFQVLQQPSQ